MYFSHVLRSTSKAANSVAYRSQKVMEIGKAGVSVRCRAVNGDLNRKTHHPSKGGSLYLAPADPRINGR